MNSIKSIIILLVLFVFCFTSIEIAYSETRHIRIAPSIKSNVIGSMVSGDTLTKSVDVEEWVFAESTQTSEEKKKGFVLFGEPQSVIDYKEQTKEWEARTLRLQGFGEFLGGIGLSIAGLVAIGDYPFAGIISLAIGVGATYLGYTDLKAAKRFFYPDSLFSQKHIYDEQMYGLNHKDQNNHIFALHIKFELGD